MDKDSKGEKDTTPETQHNTDTFETTKENGCEITSGSSPQEDSLQPQSACTSRTNSVNSEGDKTEKLLKILQFRNPGPQLASFNPDKSRREQRKVKQFLQSSSQSPTPEKNLKSSSRSREKPDLGRRPRNTNPKRIRRNYHDRSGIRLSDNSDICDCQHLNCPGCHFPCMSCGSEKCGVECRCSRKWTYNSIVEIENPFAPKTELTT